MIASHKHTGPALCPDGRSIVVAGDFAPGEDYFTSLEAAFGTARLTLGIGPLRVRIEGLSDRQAADLADTYAPFALGPGTAPDADHDLSVGLHHAGVEHFLAPPAGRAEIYRMGRRVTTGGLSLWSYEFAGRADIERRAARLALTDGEGPLFHRGLENFLRVLTAAFILERGGLLIHGAGVVRRGRAYVFFGPSGSGKTTVTLLSAGDTILSDDLTLIVKSGERYEAAGIPFGMAHHRTPQTSASFPIASLNRLVQSPEVRRERLDGARALAELGGSLPFVMQEFGQASRALETAQQILDRVPAYRLAFRKDASFWSVVETI